MRSADRAALFIGAKGELRATAAVNAGTAQVGESVARADTSVVLGKMGGVGARGHGGDPVRSLHAAPLEGTPQACDRQQGVSGRYCESHPDRWIGHLHHLWPVFRQPSPAIGH